MYTRRHNSGLGAAAIATLTAPKVSGDPLTDFPEALADLYSKWQYGSIPAPVIPGPKAPDVSAAGPWTPEQTFRTGADVQQATADAIAQAQSTGVYWGDHPTVPWLTGATIPYFLVAGGLLLVFILSRGVGR